jgi:hypothetical protein
LGHEKYFNKIRNILKITLILLISSYLNFVDLNTLIENVIPLSISFKYRKVKILKFPNGPHINPL